MSEFPHKEQHLHSMHCQRYCFTEMIILGVNCKHVGWPGGARDHRKCYKTTQNHQLGTEFRALNKWYFPYENHFSPPNEEICASRKTENLHKNEVTFVMDDIWNLFVYP